VPQPGRQHVLELGQRAHGGLLDAADAAARRRAQPDGHGDGLVVVEQQGWERGPGAEPVAAGAPRRRLDGVTQLAQPFHVVADGAGAHVEPAGQFGAGPVAAGLEQ
jgi:hypothetical protein